MFFQITSSTLLPIVGDVWTTSFIKLNQSKIKIIILQYTYLILHVQYLVENDFSASYCLTVSACISLFFSKLSACISICSQYMYIIHVMVTKFSLEDKVKNKIISDDLI